IGCRRHRGNVGPALSNEDKGIDPRSARTALAGKMFASLAREVAWPGRCRSALSTTLRRFNGQSGGAWGFRKAFPYRASLAAFFRGARFSRSRNSDDAVDSRRRGRATVYDLPQRLGYGALPKGGPGAVFEVVAGRRI